MGLKRAGRDKLFASPPDDIVNAASDDWHDEFGAFGRPGLSGALPLPQAASAGGSGAPPPGAPVDPEPTASPDPGPLGAEGSGGTSVAVAAAGNAQQIARWGTQFIIGTAAASGLAGGPSVAALGTAGGEFGRFVVVWAQGSDGAGVGDPQGTVGQLYNGDGSKDGGAFLVNSTPSAQLSSSTQGYAVVIDRTGDEGFAVVWQDEGGGNPSPNGIDVRMRLFDGNATPAGADFVVNTGNRPGNFEHPSIDRVGTFGTMFVGFQGVSPPAPDDGNKNAFIYLT